MRRELGQGKSRAYQLLDAARVAREIDAHSTVVDSPANEAQARELARAPEPERAEVWQTPPRNHESPHGKGALVTHSGPARQWARQLVAEAPTGPAGVQLTPGARLWDSPPSNQVAPRRANARGRGDREGSPDAIRAYPATADGSRDRSPVRLRRTEAA